MYSIYKSIKDQTQTDGLFSIVPLRSEDRYRIMRWRNEQMYHLRQNKLLTEKDQDKYFDEVIAKEFGQENPAQLLFSFLKHDECIGYGGLVHINYVERNAEISFIMDTSLETEFFEENWLAYLALIERTAFSDIKLHKIFTYAYDLRERLYGVLLKAGFYEEARLKEHGCLDGKFIDVVIHAKLNMNAQL